MSDARRTKGQGAAGFTAIEVAILVLISGVLFAAIVPLYQNYANNKAYRQTLETMRIANGALREFYGLNGRYPCPANPALPPGDANYGVEQCRPLVTDPCPPGVICTNLGSRDADGDTVADPVTIGALPFKTLFDNTEFSKFSVANGFDGFGLEISYAVSELMTDQAYTISNPANPQLGAVAVKDENNRDILQPADSAHYVIVSHGDNGKGGYTRDGVDIGDCTLIDVMGDPAPPGNNIGLGGVKVELENCDRNDAFYVSALRSFADTDLYFDDIIFFNANTASTLWRRSDMSAPGEMNLYNTNFGNVGVGLNNPSVKFQVNGDIKVDTEVMAQDGYCDLGADDCLMPEALGGAGMTPCPPGQAATGIENNSLVCAPVFTAPLPPFACPPGEALHSFSNLGWFDCDPI